MKYFLSIALLGLAWAGRGQQDSLVLSDSTKSDQVWLEAAAYIGAASRDIYVRDLLALTSGFLDQAEKDELRAAVGDRFRLGYLQGWDISYRVFAPDDSLLKQPRWGLTLYNRSLLGIDAAAGALDLAIYGNAPFAGETVDFGDLRYQNWLYTGLRYQFALKLGPKFLSQLGVALLIGHNHQGYGVDRGLLFTEVDGRYLDVEADYRIRESAAGGTYGIAGVGAALSWESRWQAWGGEWTAQLEDFGLMYWTRAQQNALDSNFRFSGIFIEDIFALRDSLLEAESEEIENSLLGTTSDSYLSLVPFRLSLAYQKRLSGRWLGRAELRYRYLPAYWPRFSAQGLYQFNKQVWGAELAYGGFNQLTLGLLYRWRLNENWRLRAGVHNLFAAVPALGQGLLLTGALQYRL